MNHRCSAPPPSHVQLHAVDAATPILELDGDAYTTYTLSENMDRCPHSLHPPNRYESIHRSLLHADTMDAVHTKGTLCTPHGGCP